MTQIHDLTVLELAAAIRGRELSPVEITAHYLDRIERLNTDVGAFYTVTAERIRNTAIAASTSRINIPMEPRYIVLPGNAPQPLLRAAGHLAFSLRGGAGAAAAGGRRGQAPAHAAAPVR